MGLINSLATDLGGREARAAVHGVVGEIGQAGGGSTACLRQVSGPAPSLCANRRTSLTPTEKRRVESDPWFSTMSEILRREIIARGVARRCADGWALATRGRPAEAWMCVVRGAVRVSTAQASGRVSTLAYLKPGMWFSDISLVDGLPCSHDATAHGETTLLCLGKSDFVHLLARHAELPEALLHLNCIRLRAMFERIEDLNRLPLAARLAKQLLLLARGYGTAHASGVHGGLHLAQGELAQLLSASRQRVNLELKILERQGILRVDPVGIVVLDDDRLSMVARADSDTRKSSSAKRLSNSKNGAARIHVEVV